MATHLDGDTATGDPKRKRLTVLVKIEQKQLEYKREYRPLFWYGSLGGIALFLMVVGIIGVGILGGNTYFGGWVTFGAVLFGAIFLIFFVGFFSFELVDGPTFFNGPQRINHLVVLKEEIEELQAELRILEAYLDQQRSALEHYREKLSQVIFDYGRQANTNRHIHYTFQLFIIFLSLVVTALTSGFTGLIGFANIPWIAAIVSFLVSLFTGITTLFRFRDRSFNLQQTADAIEFETSAADLHIFDYNGKSEQDALRELAERAERLRDEQRKRQQQLEQPSEHKQPSQ